LIGLSFPPDPSAISWRGAFTPDRHLPLASRIAPFVR
jgi:hypothetical protein